MAMASLPDHMIEQITAWLPVQSILRFRSVSKSWLSLTQHPYFINQHRTHSPLRRDASHLLLTHGRESHNQTLLTAAHGGGPPSPQPLHLPPNILEHGPFDLSCCQGLISMHPRGDREIANTFVYNPSTREAQPIPFKADAFRDFVSVRNYIGFEPVSGRYKVLILGTWNMYVGGQHCEIMTLGTQNWRQVATSGTSPRDAGDSTYLNGALHWVSDDSRCIKVFDLKSELFRTILGPKRLQEDRLIELCIVRGRLAMVDSRAYRPGVRFELWTLKNYYGGVWVKEVIDFSVPRDLLSTGDFWSYIRIVGSIDNDEIVMSLESSNGGAFSVSYDVETKKCRKIRVGGESEDKLENIMLYTESL